MHILITGATGLIGQPLTHALLANANKITIVTRREKHARHLFGTDVNYCTTLDQLTDLNAFDTVINLAGEPIIGKRWTTRQKKQLCYSRWHLTNRLAELIIQSTQPPVLFISGSAVGYYGNQHSTCLTEESQPVASFTHSLCQRWERLALQAASPHTRVCVLRTGIVLSDQGGMLMKMVLPFHFGLGSIFGSGQQFISWIHIEDVIQAILFLLATPTLQGAINLCSPEPVTNQTFSQTLAHILRRPNFLTLPRWLVQQVMGEAATMIIDGQRALPEKLIKAGFHFRYSELTEAFNDLLIVNSNIPFHHYPHK